MYCHCFNTFINKKIIVRECNRLKRSEFEKTLKNILSI